MYDKPDIPIIYDDVPTLGQKISNWAASKPNILILIDGVNGAGKTTLAKSLAKEFKTHAVHVDSYLPTERSGRFVGALNTETLKNDIRKHVNAPFAPLFIDSVCGLAVLRRIEIVADQIIYIRRRSRLGVYLDTEYYGSERERKEAIRNWSEVREDTGPSLLMEVLSYHENYRPHEKASLIYERKEDETFDEHVFITSNLL